MVPSLRHPGPHSGAGCWWPRACSMLARLNSQLARPVQVQPRRARSVSLPGKPRDLVGAEGVLPADRGDYCGHCGRGLALLMCCLGVSQKGPGFVPLELERLLHLPSVLPTPELTPFETSPGQHRGQRRLLHQHSLTWQQGTTHLLCAPLLEGAGSTVNKILQNERSSGAGRLQSQTAWYQSQIDTNTGEGHRIR